MKVRKATWDDHAELLVLTRNAELKHVRDFSNKFIVNPEAYAAGRVLIVRKAKLIIGFVVVNHRLSRKDYTSINFIGVHPNYRNRGVARKLVEAAMKDSPWSRMRAHVACDNPDAIKWYQHMGWARIGEGAWKKGPYVTMELTA